MTTTIPPTTTDALQRVRAHLAPDSTCSCEAIRATQGDLAQQLLNLRGRAQRLTALRNDRLVTGDSVTEVNDELSTVAEYIARLEEAEKRLPARLAAQEATERREALDAKVARLHELSEAARARAVAAAPYHAALQALRDAERVDHVEFDGLRHACITGGRQDDVNNIPFAAV